MKFKKIIIALLVLFATISCNTTSSKEVSVENSTPSKSNKNSAVATSIPKVLFGKWFTPHAAMLHIVFKEDHTFVFNNSDEKGNDKLETGTFTFQKNEIILTKSDKTIEKFTFQKGKDGDTNYYLQNEEHYMVKSDE